MGDGTFVLEVGVNFHLELGGLKEWVRYFKRKDGRAHSFGDDASNAVPEK